VLIHSNSPPFSKLFGKLCEGKGGYEKRIPGIKSYQCDGGFPDVFFGYQKEAAK